MRWRGCVIRQRIRLAAHSARLDFVTELDWHETHTLLKAAFPTSLNPRKTLYDIQWGHVSRATTRDTPFDAARFEVPAHKWAQISEGTRAVAMLNDCKYGHDVLNGNMRITLVKSSTSPDPNADQGHHRFTYALLPYASDNPRLLDHEAYDLNAPLRFCPAELRPTRPMMCFVEAKAAGVIIETLKPADDGNGQVLRIFEARGQSVATVLNFGRPVASAAITSIFEIDEGALRHAGETFEISLCPFQILSIRVVLFP